MKSFGTTIFFFSNESYFVVIHMVLFILLLFNNLKFRISLQYVDWGHSLSKS